MSIGKSPSIPSISLANSKPGLVGAGVATLISSNKEPSIIKSEISASSLITSNAVLGAGASQGSNVSRGVSSIIKFSPNGSSTSENDV